MKRPREDVIIYEYLDDILVNTKVDKNRVIKKMKDGSERISMGRGYRTIARDNGKAVFHWYTFTGKAPNIVEWLGARP